MPFDKPAFVAELAALLAKFKVASDSIDITASPASSADDTQQRFQLTVRGEWS